MAVPGWISTRADTDRDLLLAQVAPIQGDVELAEGLYLQVLSGMSGIPGDQNALAVDDGVKPSDRATSPADWGISRPATSTVSTSIDTYPGGWGIRQQAIDGGWMWQRVEWQVDPKGAGDLPWTGIEIAPSP